jgi:DNA-binding protein H-NS
MPRAAGFKFDKMNLPDLVKLRDRIQAALASRREELQRQMDALSTIGMPKGHSVGSRRRAPVSARARRGNGRAHPLKGRTVGPKYRDPENPSQTWAGRGQAPRWLAAYEAQGRKRDEFLIVATQGARTKGRRRKRALKRRRPASLATEGFSR